MKAHWVPLLLGSGEAEGIENIDARPSTALSGLVTALLNNAEPVKLTVYMLPMAMALFWVWGLFSKLHIRQPVRDLLDAHEARLDAEVMRVWTDPETRDAVRRYVDFEIDIHRGR